MGRPIIEPFVLRIVVSFVITLVRMVTVLDCSSSMPSRMVWIAFDARSLTLTVVVFSAGMRRMLPTMLSTLSLTSLVLNPSRSKAACRSPVCPLAMPDWTMRSLSLSVFSPYASAEA